MREVVSISEARRIGKRLQAKGVVVLVFNEDTVAGTSYGSTRHNCLLLGEWMDELIDSLSLGGHPTPWGMPEWQPIETIPLDRHVIVKTVTGLIRKARVSQPMRIKKGPLPTVHCWRRDADKPYCNGDLQAVAWKPE